MRFSNNRSATMQPATASRPIAGARRPAATGAIRRRLAAVPVRTWSVGTIAIAVYLFVVHSYKLNLGTASIAVGLFGVLLHERPIRLSTPMLWYVIYLGWALITLPSSTSPPNAFDAWVEATKIFLIMFLVYNAIRTPSQHRIVTLAWLGMFALYPARGTLFNFLGGYQTAGRYGWNFQFSNFNDMAALTLIPLSLSLERLRSNDKPWVKACALAGVISLPFIVLITQSRGGMLGLGAMMLFLLARSRYRAKMAAAVCTVGLVTVLFAPQSVWDRISGMQYLTSVETLGQSDSSAEQRYLIWQVARKIIADNPVLGVGIGNYPQVHEVYARSRPEWAFGGGARDTHSTYLHVLAETGAIGFCLFFMIYISAYYELQKTARALRNSALLVDKQMRDRCQAYQAAIVGLGVCAIFDSMQSIVFPFFLLALAAASLKLRAKSPATNPPVAARTRNRLTANKTLVST